MAYSDGALPLYVSYVLRITRLERADFSVVPFINIILGVDILSLCLVG